MSANLNVLKYLCFFETNWNIYQARTNMQYSVIKTLQSSKILHRQYGTSNRHYSVLRSIQTQILCRLWFSPWFLFSLFRLCRCNFDGPFLCGTSHGLGNIWGINLDHLHRHVGIHVCHICDCFCQLLHRKTSNTSLSISLHGKSYKCTIIIIVSIKLWIMTVNLYCKMVVILTIF